MEPFGTVLGNTLAIKVCSKLGTTLGLLVAFIFGNNFGSLLKTLIY